MKKRYIVNLLTKEVYAFENNKDLNLIFTSVPFPYARIMDHYPTKEELKNITNSKNEINQVS